jgi:hypothetical protein
MGNNIAREENTMVALVVSFTTALGLVALSLGVFALGRPPSAGVVEKQGRGSRGTLGGAETMPCRHSPSTSSRMPWRRWSWHNPETMRWMKLSTPIPPGL